MVADLCLPVRIVGGETVREPDGLALSSRNRYLDPEQRQEAARLSAALCDLLGQELGVPRDRIYIEFSNASGPLWGWNGATF